MTNYSSDKSRLKIAWQDRKVTMRSLVQETKLCKATECHSRRIRVISLALFTKLQNKACSSSSKTTLQETTKMLLSRRRSNLTTFYRTKSLQLKSATSIQMKKKSSFVFLRCRLSNQIKVSDRKNGPKMQLFAISFKHYFTNYTYSMSETQSHSPHYGNTYDKIIRTRWVYKHYK